MKVRAAIYARQSRTTEGSASLDIQVETCRDVAARFEVEVTHELVEPPSTSGFKNRGRDRPGFKELLSLIATGQVDAVIVYQTDRLSRGGGVGWAPLLEAIEEAGHDASHFILRPDGWLSEFELGIRAAVDREEASKLSARMIDVRAREAREGKPRVGTRSYGYSYDRSTKALEVIVAEAETVRECVNRVLDGETAYAIAKDLNKRGIATATGKRWKTSTLLGVLRSPRIAGLRSHHGDVIGKGRWEPIISEDEHHRVLAVTEHRGSHGAKKAARTFPLVGFLRCGKCGADLRSMTSSAGEKKRRRYACRGGEAGGCGGIQIKAEFVETAVRDYVVGVLANPDLRDALVEAAPAPDNSRHVDTVNALRKLTRARERLTDLAVEGGISTAEVRRKNRELDEEQARLERELAAVPMAASVAHLPLTADDLDTAWNEGGINFQRQLTNLLVQCVTVNPAPRLGPGRFDPGRLEWQLRN